MDKQKEFYIDSSTIAMVSVACGGLLSIYIDSALNQIPNVPENGNLRKEFEHNFEYVLDNKLLYDYQNILHEIEDSFNKKQLSEDEVVTELVKILGTTNNNTKYLQMNYKQMMMNRLKNSEITPERLKEISNKQYKNVTKKELDYFLRISAMHDVSRFLSAELQLRSGMDRPAEQKVNQNNRYLQVTNDEKNDFSVNKFKQLLDNFEKSLIKYINLGQTNKLKDKALSQPDVLFVDMQDLPEKDWQVHATAKFLPSKLYGDTDLRECLIMEFMIQKSLNEFLEKLVDCGYDVDVLLSKVQKIIIEKESEAAKKAENKNIVPMQQTAGKNVVGEEPKTKKKSQFVEKFLKLKKMDESSKEM